MSYHETLTASFHTQVQSYRQHKHAELEQGEVTKLYRELTRLHLYLDGVRSGLARDHPANIQFNHAKANVLSELLGARAIDKSTEPVQVRRDQLRELAGACQYMYQERGLIQDTLDFAHRLTSTLRTDDGKIIGRIKVHAAKTSNGIQAYFQPHRARLASQTVHIYTLNHEGRLEGKPPLNHQEQHDLLVSLSQHLLEYS